MMNWPIIAAFLLFKAGAPSLHAGVIVDRVAVVVDKAVIKASDIDLNLRLTAFLNHEPLNITSQSKRDAAERLVDQQIIREEMLATGIRQATREEAASLEEQFVKDRFAGSRQALIAALRKYGLTEANLQDQFRWQLQVLRFIDERFRVGVLITDEDLHRYYDQHSSELKKQYPQDSSYATLAPKLRDRLIAERVDQNFDMWLEQARGRAHVEYKEEAFR